MTLPAVGRTLSRLSSMSLTSATPSTPASAALISEADAQSYVSMPSGPGVTAAIGKVEEVATGASHTVVRLASGQMVAFGSNEVGQLGSGDGAIESFEPVLVALPE